MREIADGSGRHALHVAEVLEMALEAGATLNEVRRSRSSNKMASSQIIGGTGISALEKISSIVRPTLHEELVLRLRETIVEGVLAAGA